MIFCKEEEKSPFVPEMSASGQNKAWKILVVDDEVDIHRVTELVLSDFKFDHKTLDFIHAYSAEEARDILSQQSDIAVALVDVVMETTHAGLNLIKYIREDLNNQTIRLILRTGQPGEAPEESVIRNFDINDYKNKTELTAIKLKTLMYSTLRGYRDLILLDRQKQGLEQIIAATVNFLECDTLAQFASTILTQVANVLGLSESKIYCCAAIQSSGTSMNLEVLAVSDQDNHQGSGQLSLPDHIDSLFNHALSSKCSLHGDDYFVGYFTTRHQLTNLLYVTYEQRLSQTEHDLLEFFANNIAVAYDNLRMREIVKESQHELSYMLGEAVEHRSKETGSHVKRVANYSFMLATLYGLPEAQANSIKLASPLHDLGKIAIPDHILNKPTLLTDDEWEVMKTHAQLGYELLNQSRNEILQIGATIAHQHHEKYDGSGYPQQLAGEDIHIAGRITALADVFDALASNRCYKPAWPMSKVLNLLQEESGKHFDPKLVSLLLDNIDDFLALRDVFPDSVSIHPSEDLEKR